MTASVLNLSSVEVMSERHGVKRVIKYHTVLTSPSDTVMY